MAAVVESLEGAETKRLVLVIDNHPEHVSTIEHALNGSNGEHYSLISVSTGEQALDFLYRRGAYETAPRPDIILLDLNLAGKTGREVLMDIKSTPHLRRIPIVVLTLVDSEDEIFNSYDLQGNCYVIKSADLDQLHHLVKQIENFWLGIVTLPVE